MTALQKVKEVEAKKAAYVAEKQAFDEQLRLARQSGGTTVEMRAKAQELQMKIEATNKELGQARREMLSASAGADLLPCPFCGSVAALTNEVHRHGRMNGTVAPKLWFVLCVNRNCGCHLPKKFSPIEAVRVWQQRVEIDQ